MKIDISGSNPTEVSNGMEYELMAESCVPGIITNDYKVIFEEQTILKNIQMIENDTEAMNYST